MIGQFLGRVKLYAEISLWDRFMIDLGRVFKVPRVRLCPQRPQEAFRGPALRGPGPESGPPEEVREAPNRRPAAGVGRQGHAVRHLVSVRHQVNGFLPTDF